MDVEIIKTCKCGLPIFIQFTEGEHKNKFYCPNCKIIE